MEQNQNPANMPVARLDPAVMNLDPSLSHLDKSALVTTKDNASRAIGDGPAFIDAIKIPGINATAESRKELTGTTADEQGMRLTNPIAGSSNFNAPAAAATTIPTSTITNPAQRGYANTGESMFQRSEESGLPHGQQLPTGSSTFGPGGPSAGPSYAYNTPHDLLTSAGPTRPPVGVNDRLEGQEQREDRELADNSNFVAKRGAFNDPTISSGQNLADPNLRQQQQLGQQQQGFQQQQQGVDRLADRTHRLDLGDDRTPAFMHEVIPPNRLSETSNIQDSDSRPLGTFQQGQQNQHLPTIDPLLKAEIIHHTDDDFQRHVPHPSIGAESGLGITQDFDRRADASFRPTEQQPQIFSASVNPSGAGQPIGYFIPSDTAVHARQPEFGHRLHRDDQPLQSFSNERPLDSSVQPRAYDTSSFSSDFASSRSIDSSNIDSDKQVNHPEFSATSTAASFSQGGHCHGQQCQDQQQQQYRDQGVQQRDIPVQQSIPSFQGMDTQQMPTVAPAQPFQPGVHSGLRYAEPTEGLPGHSTYRA